MLKDRPLSIASLTLWVLYVEGRTCTIVNLWMLCAEGHNVWAKVCTCVSSQQLPHKFGNALLEDSHDVVCLNPMALRVVLLCYCGSEILCFECFLYAVAVLPSLSTAHGVCIAVVQFFSVLQPYHVHDIF